MIKNWLVAQESEQAEPLSQELGLSRIISQLLINRGIAGFDKAKNFLYPKRNQSHSPWLLPDMDRAVAVIKKALAAKEKILLFGDYDVDDTGVVMGFDSIKGRVNDLLRMPDGCGIHSVGLFHCIHQEPVWSIQLVIGEEGMRLRLATREMTEAMESRIRKRLRDLHPDLATCPVEIVDDVETNRAGKRRGIVDERW